ncbi:MAG: adenine deaminase [Chloroflexi bacterium]|nr:adenine deaminase [Chloroflexota bacterium]
MADLSRLIAAARGDLRADFLLVNARVVNVFSGEIESGNIAIFGDRIAGVGPYKHGKRTFDLNGAYVCPGFIDGHTHIESSMLHPVEYARAVVPRGTTGVVTDLHEIANVGGMAGMKWVIEWARRLPLSFYFMAPPCVPATGLETAGASLGVEEIRRITRWKGVMGVGEVMNFQGVIAGDAGVLKKIEAAPGKAVDGHAPGLSGLALNAYIAAGIHSDHESTILARAAEKLSRGMYIMIREGSSEKNLATLLPLVTEKNCRRCFFVIDDRSCGDLKRDGDMDAVLRQAVRNGLDPVRAIQMATLNPARYLGLRTTGAIAPGYFADLVVLDDLEKFNARMVLHRGKLVARDGQPAFGVPPFQKEALTDSFHLKPLAAGSLLIPAEKMDRPVIEVVPGQIVTRKIKSRVKIAGNFIVADTERDILKLAVVERHKATGNIGLGLVRGFGLKRGALASSIAHDSHNIVVAGANDADMLLAIREVVKMRGGLVVAAGGEVLASLPLPVAGLLSLEPLEVVVERFEKLENRARELGCILPAPFAALSFLAAPVIPELRLTDRGLVDVAAFKILD